MSLKYNWFYLYKINVKFEFFYRFRKSASNFKIQKISNFLNFWKILKKLNFFKFFKISSCTILKFLKIFKNFESEIKFYKVEMNRPNYLNLIDLLEL